MTKPMKNTILLTAILAQFLAACAPSFPAPPEIAATSFVEAQPVAMRVIVSGDSGPVISFGNTGTLRVSREGAQRSTILQFENGGIGVYDLVPDHYEISTVGSMDCSGVTFEVVPGDVPSALGTLSIEVVETEDYNVALISWVASNSEEIADIAQLLGVAPGMIVTQSVEISRAAKCYRYRHGKGKTSLRDEWQSFLRSLPKVMPWAH